MRWLITKDHLWKEGESTPSRVGKGKHRETSGPMIAEFRLYDDDGELYYSGRCDNPETFPEDQAFAPLNYGMADAGCTRMDYKLPGGEWRTL